MVRFVAVADGPPTGRPQPSAMRKNLNAVGNERQYVTSKLVAVMVGDAGSHGKETKSIVPWTK